jgi:hypothetical protein
MKRAKKHAPPKLRNPVARSPLLGKGGVHGPSEKALRRRAKTAIVKLARELDDFS